MPHAPFVHLRVQSAYSMLEGAMMPSTIAEACRAAKFPAVALTDRNNLFGAMEFSEACRDFGVQPIIGALVAVERPMPANASRSPLARLVADWLVLLVQDKTGYDNLIGLVSDAHLASDTADTPHLTLAGMAGRTDGLIALTAGPEGALARLIAEEQDANAYADALVDLFPGRLYVEISRSGDGIEAASEAGLLSLAYARDLPLVATNPVRFANASVHPAHDVLLCIADGAYVDTEERRRSNPEHWLKTAATMVARFADLPEATANTLVVARRCAYKAPSREPILPSLAGDPAAEAAQLGELAAAGLDARLTGLGIAGEAATVYRDRLAYEIGVIVAMGFPGYFLIVADFIMWAKAQGIPVGPGRGSGAGSVVAWALTITDLDPLQHGLIFERFLNPERVSMPDFDIDFCETRRGEVIRYVQQRYGRGQVAQIITFGKLKARAVLKDVGRVLQMPYGQVDRIAKLVPNHPTDPWTLARAINGVSEIVAERDRDPKVAHLLEIAQRLEGLPRHSSTHAAGVVIGDRPLSQLVPMYRDPRSDMPVTQFDMKWVEKAGLVKFDFLGLKTLSVLERAKELLALKGVALDLAALPLDDAATYRLIARGDTVGVFQFESEGMRRALTQVRPDCFADIIALGALYRPGPMENIPSFGRRKNGEETPDYLHPTLEGVLKETYGVIIYQEQVMQIAQILAGYSLGEADLLRRAMGKKIKAEMEAQKARFASGAAEKGVDKRQAAAIFDLVAKFAGYGFNKSHAAAYALLSYHTAWLKTHHAPEFFAASMAFDIGNTDRLAIFVDDMRRMGVPALAPCINASAADFVVAPNISGDDGVRYGLAALKSVGERAMAGIVDERVVNGVFTGLSDFARRIDPKLLNKRQLEALIGSGAFDGIEANRGGVYQMAEALLSTAQSAAAARESMQVAMFGGSEDRGLAMLVPPGKAWNLTATMAHEKEAFGFYFSGHPVESFAHVLTAHGAKTYAQASAADPPSGGGRIPATLAGLIEDTKWRTPQNGKSDKYLLLVMSDAGGQYPASCFDESAQTAVLAAAAAGEVVLIQGELMWRPGEETPRVTVRGVKPLAALAGRLRCRLTVDLAGTSALDGLVAQVGGRRGGRGEIVVSIGIGSGNARLLIGNDFAIDTEVAANVGRLRGVIGTRLAAID